MTVAGNILASPGVAESRAAQAVPLLSVREIEKRFRTKSGEEVHALNRISIDLADGEFGALRVHEPESNSSLLTGR